jgi:hypothetical protein
MATVLKLNEDALKDFFIHVTMPSYQKSSVTNSALPGASPFLNRQANIDIVEAQARANALVKENEIAATQTPKRVLPESIKLPEIKEQDTLTKVSSSPHAFFASGTKLQKELANKAKHIAEPEKPASKKPK